MLAIAPATALAQTVRPYDPPLRIEASDIVGMPSAAQRAWAYQKIKGSAKGATHQVWLQCDTFGVRKAGYCIAVKSGDVRPGQQYGDLAIDAPDLDRKLTFESRELDPGMASIVRAAKNLAGKYQFRKDLPDARTILFQVTLAASDVPPPGDPSAPLVEAKDVEWANQPDWSDIAFEMIARYGPDPARVEVDCRFAPDLSLFCDRATAVGKATPLAPDIAAKFEALALLACVDFRAKPVSRSGVPLAGKRVTIKMTLVPTP